MKGELGILEIKQGVFRKAQPWQVEEKNEVDFQKNNFPMINNS